MKPTRTSIIIAGLPSLLMLGLFYSLAIHLRLSLGAWPESIGTNGFSDSLVAHGRLAWNFCSALFAVSLFVLPVAFLVCLLVARWRRFVIYFALYALFYGICWGLMLLAPARFLSWWWD